MICKICILSFQLFFIFMLIEYVTNVSILFFIIWSFIEQYTFKLMLFTSYQLFLQFNFYFLTFMFIHFVNCIFVYSVPKPVFHCNGKKSMHQRIHQDSITPQHEEIIRYINDSKFTLL